MSTFGARFLVAPDLFPRRLSGEPAGGRTHVLALPLGAYAVNGLSELQADSVRDRFGESAPGDLAVTIDVFVAPPGDFVVIDTAGWTYEIDMQRDDAGLAIAGMNLMARIDRDLARVAVWTPVEARDSFWGVLENVLRPLLAFRLLARGGLLVHSAAAILGERGFLFAGRSGAGKSTIAQLALASGRPVLSDDLNAVLPRGSAFALAPLPFSGDLTREQLTTSGAPLAAVCALEKRDTESVAPLAASSAAALLVQSAPYVNRDAASIDLLLERANEIAVASSTLILAFPREGNPWPILERS